MDWDKFLDIIGTFLQGAGWVCIPILLLPVLRLMVRSESFVAKLSNHLIVIIDNVSNCVGEIIKWALPLLVLSVAFGVFADSIFGLSWTKLDESARYCKRNYARSRCYFAGWATCKSGYFS